MSSLKYRAEIDGLRALAVIPVILFHFCNNLLPGGYIGVDVFFVISGFLITSLILDEHERGVFKFLNFWLRRVRRILPALTAMVLITLIVGRIVLYAPDINILGNYGLAALLSFSNISHWLLAGNYWGPAAETSPFLHTWTLSVEEQFYLFFPMILILILKYLHKWLLLIYSLLCLLSILVFLVGSFTYPSATFYLLPTRAWELGIGALFSIIFFKHDFLQPGKGQFLSVVGFFAILISYFTLSGNNGISPLLIIPVLGSALIIAFARDTDNIINRILSASPVVYVGKISYSLYLWHWPILVFLKQLSMKHNTEINVIYFSLATFIISVLSYHFIEVPIRKNNKFVPYVLCALLVLSTYSYFLKVGVHSEDISFYSKTEWYGNQYNVSPDKSWSEYTKKRMYGISVADNNIDVNTYSSGGIIKLYGNKKPDILVLGDSHALMWARVIDEVAKELSLSISFYSADATPTFFNIPPSLNTKGTIYFSAKEKYIFDKARLKYLTEWKPKIVVIACSWSNINKEATNDLIHYIGRIGSEILLIEQPPVLYFGDKNTPQYLSYLGLTPSNNLKQFIQYNNSARYQEGINLVKQLSEKNNFCFRLPISDLFLDNDKVWVIDSNDVLYIDEDHLSYSGALKAKDRIFAAVKRHLK